MPSRASECVTTPSRNNFLEPRTNQSNDDPCVDKYFEGQTLAFQSALQAYRGHLERMVDLNEVYNANQYISEVHGQKNDRLKKILRDITNKENIMRQQSRLHLYNQQTHEFYNRFARYTIVMFNAVFILAALYKIEAVSKNTFIAAVAIVMSFFLSLFLLGLLNKTQRRKEDWSKFDWGGMQKQKPAGSA